MSEKKFSSDAVEWSYNRYIKGDPEREASFREASKQSDMGQQIYDIREKFRMSREDLAELSGLTPETIEDLEETDYDGDWDEAMVKINRAFHNWFSDVILPAARMKPEDYSVKEVNA
jgi:DNA-binding XRE family transcriptional regulator